MQNEKIKMQISKWKENILLNLHFSFCNLQLNLAVLFKTLNCYLHPLSPANGKKTWLRKV